VDHDKFRQLRKQVTGSAIVYGKKVLPFSELVVKAIHNYFEDYFLSIEFADFCECLDDLTKELNAAQKVVNCTKRLHENLLVEFKTFKIEAGKVSATLGLDVKKLKFQAEQHSATAKHKEAWAEIWGVLPVIGWIPAIMLKKEAERARDKQYTTEVNKQLVAQACYNIDNGLVTSVEYFAKAMSDLCGFFTQLHNDIERIDQNLEAKKKIKFLLCKKRAQKIVDACCNFQNVIPDAQATLVAVSKYEYEESYVSQWLHKQEIENQSVVAYLTEAFTHNAKYLKDWKPLLELTKSKT